MQVVVVKKKPKEEDIPVLPEVKEEPKTAVPLSTPMMDLWHVEGNREQHYNSEREQLLVKLRTLLPDISAPSKLRVGSTGYPEGFDRLDKFHFGKFKDVCGREWMLIGSTLLFQHYINGNSFRSMRVEGFAITIDCVTEEMLQDLISFQENASCCL